MAADGGLATAGHADQREQGWQVLSSDSNSWLPYRRD
jgi:hypothetical protein